MKSSKKISSGKKDIADSFNLLFFTSSAKTLKPRHNMTPKAILIDLDNTLYNYQQTHAKALHKTLHFLSTKTKRSAQEWKTNYASARENVNEFLYATASSHNRLLYFQQACESMGLSPFLYAYKAYSLYWDTFISNIVLYPEMKKFLHSIKKQKVCLITDLTADIQFRKIQTLKLDQYIDYLVTSEEAGVEKPHPAIFELAIQKLKCPKSSVIMIGDDLQKDIFGAARLNIKSYWLNLEKKSIKYKKSPLIKECHNFQELFKTLNL
jgi:HAD superfamily hydrolase (TIGR01509 family)